MKNRILFVCYGLGIGGIEKCLVNLLNTIDTDLYSVDVLPMNPIYELADSIRADCNLLNPFDYVMNTTDTMGDINAHGGVLKNPLRFVSYCLFRLKNKYGKDPWRLFRPLDTYYDVAIAYSHDNWTMNYVLNKVHAGRKVLWYHNGSYDNKGKRLKQDQIAFGKFDYVVAVSEDCKKMLDNALHIHSEKLIVLKNICDYGEIKKLASAYIPDGFLPGKTNIVTVGRLTKEKGVDLALDACSKLITSGYEILWHWIGDGNQREIAQQRIKELNLHGSFVLEGDKINPYPYIQKADIYVQPSYYEAYSTTVTEAKVLNRAIVTTDVGGMRDQIDNGENGWIVGINADSLAEAISNLIDNPKHIQKCRRALENVDWADYNGLEPYYNTVLPNETKR